MTVRGTAISMDPHCPSTLHVRALESFGCPNSDGRSTVDGIVLHITFDKRDTNVIRVYAEDPGASVWVCVVS